MSNSRAKSAGGVLDKGAKGEAAGDAGSDDAG